MLEGKAVLPYIVLMPILTITAKGQVTLRKDILAHLGVRPGDKIEVHTRPDGRIEVSAARPTGQISDVFGLLRQPGAPTLSIEQMSDIIADGWAGKR
jgi:AbrB family looped-hinge helix DNA binding protein